MENSVIFEEELRQRTQAANEIIEQYLPDEKETRGKLAGAVRYSMLAGGKRIRPILLRESFRLFQGTGESDRPFMAAIEMIHTSSLIHDDLPSIDGDEFRRGKRTTHAVYGEALGVLAGDALQNYAYETVLQAACRSDDAESLRRNMHALRILADKTGMHGMLGGQSLDVENEKNAVLQLSKDELDYIYRNKTSALIEAPLMIGAVLAGASAGEIAHMQEVGRKIGLAFQIMDDVLDVTSTYEVLGKPVGSDEKNDKTTYVTLFGVEQAEKTARRLTEEAITILDGISGNTEFLKLFLEQLAHRKK